MKQELISDLLETAKTNLVRDGSLQSVFILEKRNNDVEVIAVDFSTKIKKQISLGMIKKELLTGVYISYLCINEAWGVMLDKDENVNISSTINIKPSEHPDRQEIIVGIYKDEKGNGMLIQIPFTRDENNKVMGFLEENKQEILNNADVGGNLWDVWN